jgi:hypothetical protein
MPTISQLKKHGLYKQIKGRSKMKKAELIAALISLGGVIGSSPKKSRKPKRRVSRKRRSVKRKASRKLRKCKYGRNPVTGKCNKKPTTRKTSRKRRSVKRKTSRKRRSVKRKTSRKRRSVKRKVSRKRRSVKRKVSRKRRSVKRKVSRKHRSVKRKVSRNKRSMKRKASSRTSGKKVSRSVKRKITKPSLKVTQPMEMIYQMTPVAEIPDPLLVKFRLSPQIVHGYDLILLRNMIEAGEDADPYTNIKFSSAHIKKAKDKWDALRRTSDPEILKYLVEEEVIKDITSSIPSWNEEEEAPPYELQISQVTPYDYFIAIHIIDTAKREKEFSTAADLKLLKNGYHRENDTWRRVTRVAHWTIVLPSPGDMAVSMSGDPSNPTSWYDKKGQKRLLASNQDCAAVVGDLIKAWETHKVLTKKMISDKFDRTNIQTDKWSLNFPVIAKKIKELIDNGTLPFLRTSPLDVLKKGGDLLSIDEWDTVRGGPPSRYTPPGVFYELWAAVVEQIESLIYNETPQY